MFAVRIHGRGGQGAVTAAELLSVAAFDEGRHAQAFPTFGSERTGAPVVSFCRIDDRPIRIREPITDPDALDRAGPDAAAPGEPLRRAAARRLPAGQHLAHRSTSSGSRSSSTGCRAGHVRHRAGHRDRPRAARPAAAQRRPARRASPPSPARCPWTRSCDAIRARFPGEVGDGQRPRPPRRPTSTCWRHLGGRPMLSQIEGSQAVARAVALCRPAGGRGVPDLAADAHRRVALRPGPHRRARALRVPHGRVRVRRHVGLHRRLGRRRPHLHRDLQPGAAVHGRGAVQRLRPGAADRDDGGEPGDRRADQHLERPLRRDVDARLGLDPALRGVQPGGGGPARPGLPAGRDASRCR